MADITLGGTVAPGGPFPIARDTDLYGGFRVVATTAARNAIITAHKTVGMFVFVQADSTLYRLQSTGPDVWVAFATGVTGATEAQWQLTSPRFFALDYVNGNDLNAGFSDISMAAAGLVAKKTWEGMAAIIPFLGAGRAFEIAVRPNAAGATYLKQDAVTSAPLELNRYIGYSRKVIRATDDNVALANSTAFSGSPDDKIYCGARIVSGTEVNGYRLFQIGAAGAGTPVTAMDVNGNIRVEHDGTNTFVAGERVFIGGTSESFYDSAGEGFSYIRQIWSVLSPGVGPPAFTLITNGFGNLPYPTWTQGGTIYRIKVTKSDGTTAAGFTADNTSQTLIGKRLRGSFANATAATRNFVLTILGNGTDTIVLDGELPASTTSSDIWFIEEPNVAFESVTARGNVGDVSGWNVAGIRSIGTIDTSPNEEASRFAFCQGTTFAGSYCTNLILSNVYTDAVGAASVVGSCRFSSTVTITDCPTVSAIKLYAPAAVTTFRRVPNYFLGAGNYLFSLLIENCGIAGASEANINVGAFVANGSVTTVGRLKPTRIVRSTAGENITLTGSHGFISNVQIENRGTVGANQRGAACLVTGIGSTWIFDMIGDVRPSNITTLSGNGQSGLRMTNTSGCQVCLLTRAVQMLGLASTGAINGWAPIVIDSGSSLVVSSLSGSIYFFEELRITDIKDNNMSRIFLKNGTLGAYNQYQVSLQTPVLMVNDEVAGGNIFRGAILRTSSTGGFNRGVTNASGDSLAHASGIVGISAGYGSGGSSHDIVTVVSSGLAWVRTDALVTKGAMLYLYPGIDGSTGLIGIATATPPVFSGVGGNQKLRIGYAQEVIQTSGDNNLTGTYALVDLGRMELMPVEADGQP